jgi:hypothetical protein
LTALIEPGAPVKKTDACSKQEIDPNPASPEWDTPAATTQCGMLETDNLLVLAPMGEGTRQQTMVTTARYGLTPRWEVRWGLPGRMSQGGGGSKSVSGTTDQWLGTCYRFRDQGRWMPDLALDYAVKIPTANPSKGFGSGFTDHQITFIASRDVGPTHFDFNTVGTLAGSSEGRDGAAQFGMAVTRTVNPRLLWTIEGYGGPQPGTADRYGAVMTGGAWSVHPWLAINAGYIRAFTSGLPREQLLLGFIYTLRPGFTPSRLWRPHGWGR